MLAQTTRNRPRAVGATRAARRWIDLAATRPDWALPSLTGLDEQRARAIAAKLLDLGPGVLDLLVIPARRPGSGGLLSNRIGWLLCGAWTLIEHARTGGAAA